MALDLTGVHELRPVPGQQGVALTVLKAPYKRFVNDGQRIIVQRGQFYGDGGQKILKKDAPEWLLKRLDELSDEARESVGLKPKKGKKEEKDAGLQLSRGMDSEGSTQGAMDD